ncbi:MAG: hypothetical protein ACK53Y_02460, partial [bacterium]
MDNYPPNSRGSLAADLSAIFHDVALGITHQRAVATDTTWHIWSNFCRSLDIDPTLQDTNVPILPLKLFALRYRCGDISPRKSKVRSKTVGDAVRS